MNKEMPSFLPPLPEDCVYLGKGGEFKAITPFKGYSFLSESFGSWNYDDYYSGTIDKLYYAAHKDSEIAKLNNITQEKNNNMKKEKIKPPFYVRTYGNEQIGRILVEAAIKAGYYWNGGDRNVCPHDGCFTQYEKQHTIFFGSNDTKSLTFGNGSTNQSTTEVSVADWLEYFEENPLPPSIEVELNDIYTAVVHPETKTVKVGCQEFSFDKINKLAEAVQSCIKKIK